MTSPDRKASPKLEVRGEVEAQRASQRQNRKRVNLNILINNERMIHDIIKVFLEVIIALVGRREVLSFGKEA